MKCCELSVILNLKRLLLIVSVVLLLFQSSIADITIKIKKFSKIEHKIVKLSDIAHIDGQKEDKDFIQFISNIPLIKAPKPPETLILKKSDIINKLKKYHIDMKSVHIVGSEKTLITVDYKEISSENLKGYIKSFLKKKYPNIKIISISIIRKEIYALKNQKLTIKEKNKTKNYLYLTAFVGDEIKIPVTVKFKTITKVIVAKRDIHKNQTITIEDVELAEKELRRGYLTEYEQVIGAKAKRNIKKGTILKNFLISPNYKVKKGKKVKIVYHNGNIRIELLGKALENGNIGDTIKIKNISSKKVIRCKVIGKDTVTIQ